MKSTTALLAAPILAAALAGHAPAETWFGASPAWTETAAADRQLMGDYQGRWIEPPNGHYHYLNPEFVAHVANIEDGRYRLTFMQEFARRANIYTDIEGRLDGETIRFDQNGWQGEVTGGRLTGSIPHNDQRIRFELERVERASPTLGMAPPDGAIVLFDGSNFDAWQHGDGREVSWHLIEDHKAMEVRPPRNREERQAGIGGDIVTRQPFGSVRLHIEYRYPVEPGRSGQGRGNSGVFLQNTYEVQVLNSYALTGYWNENGALYKHSPPMVNASLPPGQWQTYDIIYTAPVFENGGKTTNGRITVRHNGVLIHNDVELLHSTAYAFRDRGREPADPAPIRLQDHGNAIQFRNIWLLEGDGR